MVIDTVSGYATQILPTAGTYNYAGVAFTQNEQGKLNYSVNFDEKTGSGSISGITAAGNITLNKGNIEPYNSTDLNGTQYTGLGITSTATSEKAGSGNYHLGFFGPNAEEVAGVVEDSNGDALIGFGGAKK